MPDLKPQQAETPTSTPIQRRQHPSFHCTENIWQFLDDQTLAAHVRSILDFMKSVNINLPILLWAISWNIPELISDLKVSAERTAFDTSLCLPGFSGLRGSVSSGEPALISVGCLRAEGADGCSCHGLLIDVDGHLIVIRTCDRFYIALDYAYCLRLLYLYLSSLTCCLEQQVESPQFLGTIHRFHLTPRSCWTLWLSPLSFPFHLDKWDLSDASYPQLNARTCDLESLSLAGDSFDA